MSVLFYFMQVSFRVVVVSDSDRLLYNLSMNTNTYLIIFLGWDWRRDRNSGAERDSVNGVIMGWTD